jgi:hypothetical protein
MLLAAVSPAPRALSGVWACGRVGVWACGCVGGDGCGCCESKVGPAGEREGAGVKQIDKERCIMIFQLLVDGKKSSELNGAVQKFDRFRQ